MVWTSIGFYCCIAVSSFGQYFNNEMSGYKYLQQMKIINIQMPIQKPASVIIIRNFIIIKSCKIFLPQVGTSGQRTTSSLLTVYARITELPKQGVNLHNLGSWVVQQDQTLHLNRRAPIAIGGTLLTSERVLQLLWTKPAAQIPYPRRLF